jgi:hypothetical protein
MTTAALVLVTMLAYTLGRIGRARAAEEDATMEQARTDLAPPEAKSQGAAPTSTTEVAGAWSACWARMTAEYPDLQVALAGFARRHPSRSRTLDRAAGAAGRMSSRVLRGSGSLRDLELRLRVWERLVLNSLARERSQ